MSKTRGISKIRGLLLLAIMLSGSFMFLASVQPVAAQTSWWNTSWGYCQTYTIAQTPNANTSYQVLVNVTYGSGSNSGNNVFCNGLCKADFGDIRFIANDNVTLLNYWMEPQTSSAWAMFYVQVPGNISAGAVPIEMYYGNPGAATLSSGTNTFLFFDDFSSNSLNTTLWAAVGTPTFSNGVITIPSDDRIKSTASYFYSTGTAMMGNCSFSPSGSGQAGFGYGDDIDNTYSATIWYYGGYSVFHGRNYNAASDSDYATAITASTNFMIFTVAHVNASCILYQVNDSAKTAGTAHVPSTDLPVCLYGYTSPTTAKMDWVAVRYYVDPEPTGTWSAEQSAPAGLPTCGDHVSTATTTLGSPFTVAVTTNGSGTLINATVALDGGAFLWVNATGVFSKLADTNGYFTLNTGSCTKVQNNATSYTITFSITYSAQTSNGGKPIACEIFDSAGSASSTDTISFGYYGLPTEAYYKNGNVTGGASSGAVTFNASKDVYSTSYQPSATEGTATPNEIQLYNDSSYSFPGWLDFNIGTNLTGQTINSATLSLYYYDTDASPAGRTITCYIPTSDSWTEDTLTYTNQPASGPMSGGVAIIPGSYGWMTWDITDYIRGVANGSITWNGIEIQMNGAGSDHVYFYTDDYSSGAYSPQLTVYNGTPSTPTSYNASLLAYFSQFDTTVHTRGSMDTKPAELNGTRLIFENTGAGGSYINVYSADANWNIGNHLATSSFVSQDCYVYTFPTVFPDLVIIDGIEGGVGYIMAYNITSNAFQNFATSAISNYIGGLVYVPEQGIFCIQQNFQLVVYTATPATLFTPSSYGTIGLPYNYSGTPEEFFTDYKGQLAVVDWHAIYGGDPRSYLATYNFTSGSWTIDLWDNDTTSVSSAHLYITVANGALFFSIVQATAGVAHAAWYWTTDLTTFHNFYNATLLSTDGSHENHANVVNVSSTMILIAMESDTVTTGYDTLWDVSNLSAPVCVYNTSGIAIIRSHMGEEAIPVVEFSSLSTTIPAKIVTAGESGGWDVSDLVVFNSLDSVGTVHLNGHEQTNFADVRLTQLGGTTTFVPYDLVTVNNGINATFLFSLSSLPAYPNNNTVTIYWGNSTITSASESLIASSASTPPAFTSWGATVGLGYSEPTVLTKNIHPAVYYIGDSQTFVANLTFAANGSGIADQNISFVIGGTAVGSGITNASGCANYTWTAAVAGSYLILVSFAGNATVDFTLGASNSSTTAITVYTPVTLTIIAPAHGSLNATTGIYPAELAQDVVILATPDPHYHFVAIEVDGVNSTINPHTVTMSADHTVAAYFNETWWNLSVSTPDGHGTVNQTTAWFIDGTDVGLLATPNALYGFLNWIIDGANSTTNPTSVTMTANHTVDAYFLIGQYYLTVSDNGHSTENATSGWYANGTVLSVNGTPNANYAFTDCALDGINGSIPPVSITMSGNHSIVFYYSPIQYNLTVYAPAGGTINATNGTYINGTLVPILATANAGYTFANWTIDGANSSTNPETITMTANHTVSAYFSAIPPPSSYSITIGAFTVNSTSPFDTSAYGGANGTYDADYGLLNFTTGGNVTITSSAGFDTLSTVMENGSAVAGWFWNVTVGGYELDNIPINSTVVFDFYTTYEAGGGGGGGGGNTNNTQPPPINWTTITTPFGNFSFPTPTFPKLPPLPWYAAFGALALVFIFVLAAKKRDKNPKRRLHNSIKNSKRRAR